MSVVERESRILRRVLLATLPLAFCVWLLLPNVGPIFRPYSIPASSMAPALPVGAYAVVSRAAYGYSRHSFDAFSLPISTGRIFGSIPARGDIIVFRLPRSLDIHYIKRVIGLPGEEVALKGGVVFINGQEVPRRKVEDRSLKTGSPPSRKVPAFEEILPNGRSYTVLEIEPNGRLDNFGPTKVPEGHLFVLGDNRDNSNDSRIQDGTFGVGPVPVELIVGKVVWTWGGG